MEGIELDMVVPDSIEALERYERIFDLERIEVTDFDKGQNEVIFKLYGLRIHMLDESPDIGLNAPTDNSLFPIWLNVTVPDIEETFTKAMDHGCTDIQPVQEVDDFGVSNAIFVDPYGYQWMLHQVHREVTFEERNKIWEEKLKGE